MATPTPNMGLEKPTPGGDFGVWGDFINGNLDLLDRLGVFPVQIFIQFGVSNLVIDTVCPFVLCFAVAGSFDLSLSLPDASGITGKIFHLIKTDSSVGSVILNTVGGQFINDSTSYTLFNQFQYVAVVSNGANWLVVLNN